MTPQAKHHSESKAAAPSPPRKLFRDAAVAHRMHQQTEEGKLLTIFPHWIRVSSWIVIGTIAFALLYLCLGTINDYAAGPAIIWYEGHKEITVNKAGTVKSIAVEPGHAVKRGQVLVRLNDEQEAAALAESQQAFTRTLVTYLRVRHDETARQSLIQLRAQRDRALAMLEDRTLKAADDYVVTDFHARPGQHVAAGESVVSVAEKSSELYVLAMLPGQYRPQIEKGMILRMEMLGYYYVYSKFEIYDISDGAIGPNEVQRFIGVELRDSVSPRGPTIFVKASPRDKVFMVDGQPYKFHHGMAGRAEVAVARRPIILALLPMLRVLFPNPALN